MKSVSDREFADMMQKARVHDAEMERAEREAGWASPSSCDLHTLLRTAEAALECAVKVRDWQTVCEGILLLQQAISQIVRKH